MKGEAKFTYDYMRSLDQDGLFWYKLPDNMYTGKKPFDVFSMKSGEACAYEFKYHHTLDVFSFSQVQEHQIDSLEKFKAAGGRAFIVLGIKLNLSLAQQEKYSLTKRRISHIKMWDVDDFKTLIKTEKSFSILKYLKENYVRRSGTEEGT